MGSVCFGVVVSAKGVSEGAGQCQCGYFFYVEGWMYLFWLRVDPPRGLLSLCM